MTAKIRQPGQDRKERIARKGQLKQEGGQDRQGQK
jgi:hypothetical protein